MQVVMNKYFILNPEEKIGAYSFRRSREKHKNRFNCDALQFRKMTSPSRRLGYSNNQLNC